MNIGKRASIKKLGGIATACLGPLFTSVFSQAHAEGRISTRNNIQPPLGPSSFVVHKLTPSLYAIGEPDYYQYNYSYLLVGAERALMFDAGANQDKDITSVIEHITPLPVAVLPSHFHFDHIGGLHRFGTTYLADIPFFDPFKRGDGRYHIPESVHLGNFDGLAFAPFKADRLIKPNERIGNTPFFQGCQK